MAGIKGLLYSDFGYVITIRFNVCLSNISVKFELVQ